MANGIFITGTDTGVGKTVVTAGLIAVLRQKGYNIGGMKPFQSGAIRQGEELLAPDIEFVLEMTDLKTDLGDSGIDYDLMNPVRLEPPLAPSVAAEVAKKEIEVEQVELAYQKLQKQYRALIVEGAGGLMVPLAEDFLIPDLIKLLDLPVIIVARPNLGTINHTVLTVKVARQLGLEVLGVIINGLKGKQAGIAEKTNPKMITQLAQVPVLGIVPYVEDLEDSIEKFVDYNQEIDLGNLVAKNVDLDLILESL